MTRIRVVHIAYRNTDRTNVGICTRHNWDNFATHTGIGLWSTHAGFNNQSPAWVSAIIVYVPHNTQREKTPAAQWQGETPDYLIHCGRCTVGPPGGEDEWRVTVSPAWFALNWASTFGDNRAIVIGGSCGSPACVQACGPRTGFGYKDHWIPEETQDMETLFGRMNGTLLDGGVRRAGAAFAAGSLSPNS